MASQYISTFNSGEFSSKMDARTDLKVYMAGCKKLENFYVLSQGGVERRTGTKFIEPTNKDETGVEGDKPAQLIPFNFSATKSYVLEVGTDYMNVHTQDLNVESVNGTMPGYLESELGEIQFVRRFDTMILTHPNHAPYFVKRTVVEPNLTFEASPVDFDYPPLLEENTTGITMQPSVLSGTGTLSAASGGQAFDYFDEGHEGSVWAINELRTSDQVSVDLGDASNWSNNGNDYFSRELNLSFVNFTIQTNNQNSAVGTATIQRSTDGGNTYEDYAILGTATAGENFGFASVLPEKSNTLIRLHINTSNIVHWGGTFSTDNIYTKGLVRITNYTSASQVNIEVISELGSLQPTIHWSEAAFSIYRGFPAAAQFFENRLWFTGSRVEPSTIFGSASGDYYNFLLDPLLDSAIKRIVDTSEDAKWLQGKRYLFMGTTGTTVSVRSANRDALINLNNIQTQNENTYGSSSVQAELANDVVIYAQSDRRKLRALYYNNDEDVYKSSNLNYANDEILSSGVKEMFIQTQPYQSIWCILNDGDIAFLTYERDEEVTGWSRMTTDGKFISGCAITGESEDVVYFCIERNGKYYIERLESRLNQEWYVDSGKKVSGALSESIDGVTITENPNDARESLRIQIDATATNAADGDIIKITNSTSSFLNNNIYKVSDKTTNAFLLKGATYDNYIRLNTFTLSNSGITVESYGKQVSADGVYVADFRDANPLGNNKIHWANYKDNTLFLFRMALLPSGTGLRWELQNTINTLAIADSNTATGNPWDHTYSSMPNATFDYGITNDGEFNSIFNSLSGLNHLEGNTVQVITEGSYNSDKVVTNGEIELDEYYTDILAGLEFNSRLQPMPIQPAIRFDSPQGRSKASTKSIVRFFKSKGGQVGEAGKRFTNLPVVNTENLAGEVIPVETGEERFFHSNDWSRAKLLEIKQDLPYPMTVLSIVTDVKMEGL